MICKKRHPEVNFFLGDQCEDAAPGSEIPLSFRNLASKPTSLDGDATLPEAVAHEGSVPEGLLDTLRDGVVVVDKDRRIKYVNASYYTQFGVTPDDIKPGDELRLVFSKMAARGQLGSTGRGNEEAFVQERLKRWGSEEGRVERRFLDNGRILDIYRSMTLGDDIISVHVDVTAAVRSEQEVERQRVYMASLLEHMSDGLALLDGNGCFAMYNQQFLDLYNIESKAVHPGMEYGEFVNQLGDLRDLAPSEREAELKLRKAFAFDPAITNVQRKLSDGRTLNINKTSLPGGGFVMTTRDITNQLRREEELLAARLQAEDSARSKSEFVARMSHEMRTPLNGILGVAALLGRMKLEKKPTDLIKVVTASGKVLLRLIDDILDLSRIDAETFQVVEEKFKLDDVISECIGTIEPSVRERKLKVKYPKDLSHIPPLRGDMIRIKQILLNLLTNAVKFTEKGEITVVLDHETGPEGMTLTLSVADTGVGIAQAELDQIFDRFYQIDGTVTRRFGGAGLGLAITRKLVDAMGGAIQVKSELGKGTTFYVRLTLELA